MELRRTDRFVDNGRLASAGGLTSGIDLALHVVDKRQGREAAEQTPVTWSMRGSLAYAPHWKPGSLTAYRLDQ